MWVFAEWKLISCEDTGVMNMEVFSFLPSIFLSLETVWSCLCAAYFLLIMDPATALCFNHHLYLSFRIVSKWGLVSRGFKWENKAFFNGYMLKGQVCFEVHCCFDSAFWNNKKPQLWSVCGFSQESNYPLDVSDLLDDWMLAKMHVWDFFLKVSS